MRVLVIDDREENVASAKETLRGHELTIARSYDEAHELLELNFNWDDVRDKYAPYPTGKPDRQTWCRYIVGQDKAIREALKPIPFDAVLTDMNLPVSNRSMEVAHRHCRAGEFFDYGFVLALRATYLGAKYVAMVTSNHHDSAMGAALDHLKVNDPCGVPCFFTINGARVVFVNGVGIERDGEVEGKDWGYVLNLLTTEI